MQCQRRRYSQKDRRRPSHPILRAFALVIRSMCRVYCRSTKTETRSEFGDAGAQTRQVLEIIKSVIETGGATMKDVVFNQIFLSDMTDYQVMNAVYREYFPDEPPARYCIKAELVRPEFLVEISSTAHLSER